MKSPDPYIAPAAESRAKPSRLKDSIAVTVWLAIDAVALSARHYFKPLFAEFDAELPRITQYLLHIYTGWGIAFASIVILGLLAVLPVGEKRLWIRSIALITGSILVTAYLLSLSLPLVTLINELD